MIELLPDWIRKNFTSEEKPDPNLDLEIELIYRLFYFTRELSVLKWLCIKDSPQFEVILQEKNPEIRLRLNPYFYNANAAVHKIGALQIIFDNKIVSIPEPIPTEPVFSKKLKYNSAKEEKLAGLIQDLMTLVRERTKGTEEQNDSEEKYKIMGATLDYLLDIHGATEEN